MWKDQDQKTPASEAKGMGCSQPSPPKTNAPKIVEDSQTLPSSIEKQERIAHALILRCKGYSYRKIGNELGIDGAEARELVAKGLENIVREPPEMVLKLELERLDRVLSGICGKALAGEYQAIDRLLRISERRTKILGLDAPDKRTLMKPQPVELTDEERRANLSATFQRLADAQKENEQRFGKNWENPGPADLKRTGSLSEEETSIAPTGQEAE